MSEVPSSANKGNDMKPVFDLGITDALLTTTRAVRKRLDLTRSVEISVILDCIKVAMQAPTAANEQSWRWMVVDDPVLRHELGEIYKQAGLAYLEAQAEQEHDPQTARVYSSAVFLAEILGKVPVHVIPCVTRRVSPGAPNGVLASLYGSILPATWSFQLALRARGLGSAWTTLHLFAEEQVAELLGIPADVTQVALLPVAYTVGTDFSPVDRPSPESVTYVNRWGTAPCENNLPQ